MRIYTLSHRDLPRTKLVAFWEGTSRRVVTKQKLIMVWEMSDVMFFYSQKIVILQFLVVEKRNPGAAKVAQQSIVEWASDFLMPYVMDILKVTGQGSNMDFPVQESNVFATHRAEDAILQA